MKPVPIGTHAGAQATDQSQVGQICDPDQQVWPGPLFLFHPGRSADIPYVVPVERWFMRGAIRFTSRLHLHFASVPSHPRAVVPNRCHGRGRLVGGSADRHVLQVPYGRRGPRGTDLWTHPRRHLRRVCADHTLSLTRVRVGSVDHPGGAGVLGAALRHAGVRGVGATKWPAFDAHDEFPRRAPH